MKYSVTNLLLIYNYNSQTVDINNFCWNIDEEVVFSSSFIVFKFVTCFLHYVNLILIWTYGQVDWSSDCWRVNTVYIIFVFVYTPFFICKVVVHKSCVNRGMVEHWSLLCECKGERSSLWSWSVSLHSTFTQTKLSFFGLAFAVINWWSVVYILWTILSTKSRSSFFSVNNIPNVNWTHARNQSMATATPPANNQTPHPIHPEPI